MSTGTEISWTECTWSPITGCTRVSPECDACYAARMSYRLEKMGQQKYAGLTVVNGKGDRHFNGVVKCHDDQLGIPLGWRKPKRIFVNSMSDTFHREVPFEFIDKMFAVMAICPQHTFQVLSKRPERAAEYFAGMDAQELGVDDDDVTGTDITHRLSAAAGTLLDGEWIWGEGKQYRKRIEGFINDCVGELDGFDEDDPDREFAPIRWPLPNVWIGTSCGIKSAKPRIDHLRSIPAAVRFLSLEPLLEDLGELNLAGIDWCITGCESGPGRRPFEQKWDSDIQEQCRAAGVAFFRKQIIVGGKVSADPSDWPEALRVQEFPEAKDAVRILEGR